MQKKIKQKLNSTQAFLACRLNWSPDTAVVVAAEAAEAEAGGGKSRQNKMFTSWETSPQFPNILNLTYSDQIHTSQKRAAPRITPRNSTAFRFFLSQSELIPN